MINKKINLKDFYPCLEDDSYILESYCPDNNHEVNLKRVRKTILILPGGGYRFVSEREGEAIALKFIGEDINVFVLKYKVAPFKYPHPLIGVYAALAYIRNNAKDYNVNVDKIAVMGFSAGGHLAASVSCYFDEDYYASLLHESKEKLVINGCILGYPVITTSTFTHQETSQNISQGDQKLLDYFSIEKHVSEKFPKTFIWHTTFDTCVSVHNSLALATSLTNKGVFYEMHIYPFGDHGQATADECVYDYSNENYIKDIYYNSQWIKDAIHFVKEYM